MADTTDTTSNRPGRSVAETRPPARGPVPAAGADGTATGGDARSGPGAGPSDGGERLWRRLAADAAVLFGLAGVAITQPLLDMFGNNPTFFVAGNYGRRNTVAFAVVIALVPGIVAFLASAPVRLAGVRAGAVAHRVLVGVLAALFGLVLCRTLGIGATVPAFALAVAVGVAVAWAEARWTTARRFLAYLAVGNVAFLALFLVASPTAELLRASGYLNPAGAIVPQLDGPVTVLILDEFPLAAILRPDGTINEERYPNIAALAGQSTWFRNASSEGATTFLQVPEILSGVRSDDDDLPTVQDHPRNLLTVFSGRYPVHAYEVVTDLCPPEECGADPPGPLGQAFSDAWAVYRHRVLPEPMRDGLPPIDQGWGDFDGLDAGSTTIASPPVTASSEAPDPMARLGEVAGSDRGRVGQARSARRELQLVTAEPSINVIHVLLPHHPYYLTPWGVASTDTWLPNQLPRSGAPNHERAFAEVYAMQAMQIAAVDELIGETIDHLKAVGAWDTGTLVVASDHGIDITAPRFTRRIGDDNEAGILRVPLFIRTPGQAEGETRDDPATTLDVVPSVLDVLGVETEWEFDGHSLYDGSPPPGDRELTGDFDDALDYVSRQQAHLLPGDGWRSVVGIGENGDLVGDMVADHRVGSPSEVTWTYDHADELRDPVAHGGRAPVQLRGTVATSGDDPPPGDLVVALDGVISGTIGGYTDTDEGWAFTGVLGPEIEGGAREVVAYEVERDGGTVTLHPLDR